MINPINTPPTSLESEADRLTRVAGLKNFHEGEFESICKEHKDWLDSGGEKGKRANFSAYNLDDSYTDLRKFSLKGLASGSKKTDYHLRQAVFAPERLSDSNLGLIYNMEASPIPMEHQHDLRTIPHPLDSDGRGYKNLDRKYSRAIDSIDSTRKKSSFVGKIYKTTSPGQETLSWASKSTNGVAHGMTSIDEAAAHGPDAKNGSSRSI